MSDAAPLHLRIAYAEALAKWRSVRAEGVRARDDVLIAHCDREIDRLEGRAPQAPAGSSAPVDPPPAAVEEGG